MDAEAKAIIDRQRGEIDALKKSLADVRAARNLYKPLALAAVRMHEAELNHEHAKKQLAGVASAYFLAAAQQAHNAEM